MGLLSSLAGIAAPIIGGAFGGPIGSAIGGALGGALSGGSKQSGVTTTTQQQQLDPQMRALLYGADGSGGLLQQIAAQANQGQSPGLAGFGSGVDSYLGGWGTDNFMRAQQAAQKLQETTNGAPQMANTSGVGVNLIDSARIGAPGQNNLDLTSAFDRTINGDAGANPYLTRALQSGIDQSTNAFGRMQSDATRNLTENILPGIKSNSIINGSYGGSRQGLAEGRSIGDYSRAVQDSLTSFGLGNTAATTGAQAQAFNQGQDRGLSALLNLSGQQYNTAAQQAQLEQQARLANQGAFQGAETTNAGLRQDTNRANLASQLSTIAQNDQRNATGIGLSSGLLGQAYGYGQNGSNATLNRLSQVGSTLAPFTGLGGSSSTSTPYYTNPAGNALGGAAGALGLYNQFAGGNKSSAGSNPGNLLDFLSANF